MAQPKLTVLPYIGPKADDTERKPYEASVKVERDEGPRFIHRPSEEFQDPADRFIGKVEKLASMLKCSEEEAEFIILHRL
jgi:hypothetical protein